MHSFGPHHGEEDCLRGWAGSGTIFFSWCNLRCVYCQNWEISWKGEGREVERCSWPGSCCDLQAMGCHNINLVTPSHVVAQVLAAVPSPPAGLRLPLVYNTGGYDSLEALALLDGVVDIYMPDMKYGDAALARNTPMCGIMFGSTGPRCGRCTGRSATSCSTKGVSNQVRMTV